MAIRLSGINSGLDTDAIVQELVSAYSLKTEKYEKASTKLTWKQDAWKSLNTKIYGLYTNVSNLRLSSAYNIRKVTVSDNTKASVTATAEATTGTQKLNILKTAQSAYITGGQLGKNVTAKTKLSELGFSEKGGTIEVKKNDGTTEQIKITSETTVNDFISSLRGAGLNANFDENNKRIFVSAKESGIANDFALSGVDVNGESALKTLGLDVAFVTTDKNGNKVFTQSAAAYEEAYKRFFEKASDLNADGMIDVEEVKTYINNQIAEYDRLQKEWNVQNGTALRTEATNRDLQEELMLLQESYKDVDLGAKKAELEASLPTLNDEAAAAQENFDNVKADVEAQIALLDPNSDTYEDDKAALEAQLTAATDALNAANEAVRTAERSITEIDRIQEIPGLIEANDEIIKNARTAMDEAKTAQAACDVDEFIAIRSDKNATEDENLVRMERAIFEMADKAVRANAMLTDTTGAYTNAGAAKVDASDAVIELNGVRFESSNNTFNINGLTINAQAVTGEGDANAIQVTTNVDAQGIYDKIKDFLTEYNNVINEMTRLYNAESAKDYEPLTDEEKEAMSEDQIEKWEGKIKDSLLRRDTTLNGVMSAMINSMAKTFEIGGQKVSLSTFGIQTMGFLNAAENEHYAYHIDGDEDDENTSGKKDKLMKAIEEDPDQVVEFMQNLAKELYTKVDEKMKSTPLSSAYKVYNDKELDSQLANYAKMIAKWEEKVKDKEDYYYKKFTQMEKAMANLNNQTTALGGLLGGGQ